MFNIPELNKPKLASLKSENTLMCGVISYLPPDESLRAARIREHQKQFDWLLSFDFPITIVEQGYTDIESNEIHGISKGKVNRISYPQGIGPQRARNEILTRFYDSNYTWLLLLDDDATMYDYYNYRALISQLQKYPGDFDDIDAFTAWTPMYTPFKKMNDEDPHFDTHWRFLKHPFGDAVPTLFMRNIAKTKGHRIFFDDTFSVKDDKVLEDVLFHLNFAKAGFKMYVSTACIGKYGNMAEDKSTVWGDGRGGEIEKQYRKNTVTYFGRPDAIGPDHISWSKLENHAKKEVYVTKRPE